MKKEVKLQIKPDKLTGSYSNLVSITVGKNEVMLDFSFLVPGTEPAVAEVVQRIVLNPETARSFLSAFQNAVLDYDKKIGEK